MSGRVRALALVIAIAGSTLLVSAAALGHGAVHERIATLTLQIRAHPNDAALLAKRGELHALDENWTQAADDFEEALALEPERADVMHHLAAAKLQLGDATEALRLAERSLERQPDPRALVVRARAHERLGSWRKAVDDMSLVIAKANAPSPETYVERAHMQERGGDGDGSIAGLHEGMAHLGPLVTLIEPAIEIEARRGRPAAALALVEHLEPSLATAPRWLAKRGELSESAGRRDEAKVAYEAALAALDRLPESRRRAPRHAALRETIVASLEHLPRVEATSPATPPRFGAWPALGALALGASLGFALQRR